MVSDGLLLPAQRTTLMGFPEVQLVNPLHAFRTNLVGGARTLARETTRDFRHPHYSEGPPRHQHRGSPHQPGVAGKTCHGPLERRINAGSPEERFHNITAKSARESPMAPSRIVAALLGGSVGASGSSQQNKNVVAVEVFSGNGRQTSSFYPLGFRGENVSWNHRIIINRSRLREHRVWGRWPPLKRPRRKS